MSSRFAGGRLFKALGIALLYLAPDLAGTVPEMLLWPYRLACPFFAWLAVRPSLPRKAQNFVLAVCVTAVSIFAMDLLLRLAPQTLFYYKPEDMFLSRWPDMPEVSRYQKNAHYKGVVVGDLAMLAGDPQVRRPRTEEFHTDRFGFRNDADAADRGIDLMIVGDSVGVGMDNSQETTWASLFQSRYGLNIYNLSTSGGPWDSLMNVETETGRLKLRPGAVLLWVISASNDLQGGYFDWVVPRRRNFLGRWAVSFSIFRNRSPVDIMVSRVWHRLTGKKGASDALAIRDFLGGGKALFLKDFLENQKLTRDEVRAHPNFPKLRAVFAQMKRTAQARGFRVAVVLIPPKEAVYEWLIENKPPWSTSAEPTGLSLEVAELSRGQGFPYLDAKPGLLREAERVYRESRDMLWWADDSHWNPVGHEAAARLAYENLLRPLLPPQNESKPS